MVAGRGLSGKMKLKTEAREQRTKGTEEREGKKVWGIKKEKATGRNAMEN